MSLTTDKDEDGFKIIATFGKKVVGCVDKTGGVVEMETNSDIPFRQAIDTDTERQVLYVTGPSGSGKSYYTRQFIEDYHKKFPKRPVYVFSSLSECKTLDKIKYLKRIKVKEEKFLCSELSAKDFRETLCIFDDCDVISNKLIKKKIFDILNQLLELGRHMHTSVVFTSHNANAGLDTKKILTESHSITIYPRNMGSRPLRYLLGEYLGMDKKEIKKIKKCNGRWVTICKTTYPMTFFDEKKVHIKTMED